MQMRSLMLIIHAVGLQTYRFDLDLKYLIFCWIKVDYEEKSQLFFTL